VTVNPGLVGVTAPDPAARTAEYRRNLRFAIAQRGGPRRLVLAENSGADLTTFGEEQRLAAAAGKELELLTLRCNDFPGELGKGFGELMLLEQAGERSRLLAAADVWVKLTGRQRVLNLPRLLAALPADVEFGGDFRDTTLYRRLGLRMASGYCDTRLLVMRPDFFRRHLRGLRDGHQRGEFSLEDRIFAAVAPLPASPRIVRRWPRQPAFRGLAGHWGKDYGSPRERLKRGARAVTRRLLPGLWI
jgi:hypothetical protein